MSKPATETASRLVESGIDGLAIKPTEVDIATLASEGLERYPELATAAPLVIDYEGTAHVPDPAVLSTLADHVDALRVTTPVRADGFDPLGDHSESEKLPTGVSRVLVAGHAAYLDEHERQRAVAPRLREAVDVTGHRDAVTSKPWVGTEGIERLALAVGGTQFELLTPTAARDVRALRAAGFDGEVALYAPTVLTDDEDDVLDAVGEYVARRATVAEALPAGAATDASASADVRRILSEAARDYALVGNVATVRERTDALREAGVDYVVAYPAAGLASLLD